MVKTIVRHHLNNNEQYNTLPGVMQPRTITLSEQTWAASCINIGN